MATPRCRKCSKPVSTKSESCPECGARPPFACSVCGKAMSMFALNFKRSKKYPYGGYSEAGEPVCYDHRQVRCYRCGNLFVQLEMRRRVVGKREDRVLRQGMAPRIEEFFGSFCPECDRDRRRKKRGGEPTEAPASTNYAVVICTIVAVGFIVLIWGMLTFLGKRG